MANGADTGGAGRANKAVRIGRGLQTFGTGLMGCGCLLTLLITVPLVLYVAFLLLHG